MTVTNWTAALLPDLTGKTVIVTGATSGLGKATADALAHAGAHVVLAVRNPAKGRAVAKGIARDTEVRELDLSSLSSVRGLRIVLAATIDVLINNAGIMQVPETRTPTAFELQFGTNHLGHFALTICCCPDPRPHRHTKLRPPPWRQTEPRRPQLAATPLQQSRPTKTPSWRTCCSRANCTVSFRLRQPNLVGRHASGSCAHRLFGHVAGASGLLLDIGSRIVGHGVDQGILPTLSPPPGHPRRNIHRPQGLSATTRLPGIVKSSKNAPTQNLDKRLWHYQNR